MREYTQKQQDEVHYIPANNAFGDALCHGVENMELRLRKNLASMDKSHERLPEAEKYHPVIFQAFRKWYEDSYRWCIDELKKGKPISDRYPPLIVERIQP